GEDDHGHERTDEGPHHADGSLLVAQHHVAPGQEAEQLAIGPYFAQAQSRQAGAASDDGVHDQRVTASMIACTPSTNRSYAKYSIPSGTLRVPLRSASSMAARSSAGLAGSTSVPG